jgi:hypothetical protein
VDAGLVAAEILILPFPQRAESLSATFA